MSQASLIKTRPAIACVSGNSMAAPSRGGNRRCHHIWRSLSVFADVIPIVVGDATDTAIKFGFDARGGEQIVRRLRATRPSVAVLCDISCTALIPQIQALGIPVVVAPQCYDGDADETLACADRLWVSSPEDKDCFSANYPADRIVVVPPACDEAVVAGALKTFGFTEEKPNAAFFAGNVGAAVGGEFCLFNSYSRVLSWRFQIETSADLEALEASFEAEGMAAVPNAFVILTAHSRTHVLSDGTAVLPAAIEPGQMSIRLRAWGREILNRRVPAAIKRENAGLFAVEPNGREIEVRGWSASDGATIVPTPLQFSASPAGNPRLFHARIALAAHHGEIAVNPAEGAGQNLTNPTIWTGRRTPSTARLRALSGRHKGETAWLIGNGPSVRAADLDRLASKLTFCFNRFHLAHAQTRLRATYTFSGDRQMIEDFGQQIVDESGGTVFIAHDQPPELLGDYIWLRQISLRPALFSLRPETIVAPGGSSLFAALQVAWFMGVRRFYIYGADFAFNFEHAGSAKDVFRSASGDGNHFIANYRGGQPWCPPSLRDIGAGFLAARRLIESEGGTIRNATHGGLLEIFERESFESAIAKN